MVKFVFFFLLCGLFLNFKQSASNIVKKNTSVFYLSDILKSYENSKLYGDENDKNSIFKQKINSNYKRQSAADLSKFSFQMATLVPSCQVSYRNYSIDLGEGCEAFTYPLVECNGYCQSKSMIWKTGEEIQEAECCKITSVSYIFSKVYCQKKLLLYQIKNRLNEVIKDDEILDAFQSSLKETPWTSRVVNKDGIKYTGYFTVKLQFDATCECQSVD